MGLVWGYYMINVGQLIDYSDTVSEAITGIDKNPLAGVMGLLCLGAIAILIWKSRYFGNCLNLRNLNLNL